MTNKDQEEALKLLNMFNYISPSDLDDIMEYFVDNGYLSAKGKALKSKFWQMFIKKEDLEE